MTPARFFFIWVALAAMILREGPAQAQSAPRAIPVEQSGAAVPQRLAPMSPVDRSRKLGVGDMVSLQILEDRTPPVVGRISDTGDIEVPYVGRISAEGKTVASLTGDIEQALERDYYYKATVRLAIDQVNREASRGKVFVSGEVKAPGAQEFFSGDTLTVGAAVLRAGSFTQWANKRDVRLVRQDDRGGSQTFKVDLKAVLEDGEVQQDLEVKDGDYIIVRKRLINF